METTTTTPYHAPIQSDASRPSLGFPLGTAMLLIIIFSLSGIFSCCYHWERIQNLRRSFFPDDPHDLESAAANDADDGPPSKPTHLPALPKMERQSIPVIMPGDRVPKFIALPCPCEPPRPENIIVEPPHKPIKPPPIAVPLY